MVYNCWMRWHKRWIEESSSVDAKPALKSFLNVLMALSTAFCCCIPGRTSWKSKFCSYISSLSISNQYCCWCCCYWPPVHEVCLNYEVVEFQLWKLTTQDLGSAAYFDVVYLIDLTQPLLLLSDVPPPLTSSFACLCHHHHRIIHPPWHPPSPSQNTKKPSPSLL